MLKKSKIRQLAMQVLFVWDAHATDDRAMATQAMEEEENPKLREAAIETAQSAWQGKETVDAWLERLAPQWPPKRQPSVDRAILRLAVWELTHKDTEPKIVIDEAIELAKEFSTQDSASFVNGVLDSVLKEIKALKSV